MTPAAATALPVHPHARWSAWPAEAWRYEVAGTPEAPETVVHLGCDCPRWALEARALAATRHACGAPVEPVVPPVQVIVTVEPIERAPGFRGALKVATVVGAVVAVPVCFAIAGVGAVALAVGSGFAVVAERGWRAWKRRGACAG